VVATDACPSMACMRWMGAPRSGLWLACVSIGLPLIRRCLARAHEAEFQHRFEKAKQYAATGQRLLERLRQQAHP
jgi:hypothetical protein